MLVLSRRIGEKIDIGDGITVTVLKVTGKTIRLGIEAPDAVSIRRSEIVTDGSSPNPPQTSESESTTLGSHQAASRF